VNFRIPSVTSLAVMLLLVLWSCQEAPPVEIPGEFASAPQATRRPADGTVHLVRLVQRGHQYTFEPAELIVQSGDVVRFVLAGPQPESVAFDTAAATGAAADFVRDRSLHLGVLMIEPGQVYEVSFAGAPPGSYPFFSIPHAEQGMRGSIEVR
jgi:plastocyanin